MLYFLPDMQARGYIGRYCTYTGDGFQEGVSLTAADEVIRLRKYAYGSCEIMLNQFKVRSLVYTSIAFLSLQE